MGPTVSVRGSGDTRLPRRSHPRRGQAVCRRVPFEAGGFGLANEAAHYANAEPAFASFPMPNTTGGSIRSRSQRWQPPSTVPAAKGSAPQSTAGRVSAARVFSGLRCDCIITFAAGQTSKHWPLPPSEHRNFLDCVKSRKPTTYTAETLQQLCTSLHAADISIRLDRKLKWDSKKEEFIDDDAANAMRSREARDDWKNKG